MSDMDEFPEGDNGSEPADAPGTIPSDDKPARGNEGFDSSSAVGDVPAATTQRGRQAARLAQSRKAFADAVLANKDKPAPATAADEYDPEGTAPIAAKADTAALKAAEAKPVEPAAAKQTETPAPAAVAPPAPSLDPEVRKLREEIKRERDQIAAERAELEKAKSKPVEAPAAPATVDLESYIDHPPTGYRAWLESMRGEKLTDDEFKAEISDFITMASADVLGVPLPQEVRSRLDAAQAKKIVRTHKTIQTRKEAEASARAEKERAAASEKAEIDRVEGEWNKASHALSQQFTGAESVAAKSHPWLAAEDEPGKIIVDVIRAALTKDGTQLSWQEAAKQANDYLESEAKKYYGKRSALLATPAPAAKPAAPAPAAKPTAPAPVEKQVTTTTPSGNEKWNRDKHLDNTRAAFRKAVQGG